MISIEMIIISTITPIIIGLFTLFSKNITEQFNIYLWFIINKYYKFPTEYIIKSEYVINSCDRGGIYVQNIDTCDNSKKYIESIMFHISQQIDKINYNKLLIKCNNYLKKQILCYLEPYNNFSYNDMDFILTKIENKQDKSRYITLTLTIKSYTHNYNDILKFINLCYTEYNNKFHPIEKPIPKFYIKDNNNNCYKSYKIYTTITFDNLFLNKKKNIIHLLDKLKNNKINKLGFLLYGAPGSGKTSIIKSIINYTQRDCINIKLKDIIDINELINIFHNDYICNQLIPMNNRIYILEDIDCDNNIIQKRKFNNDEDDENILLDPIKKKCSILKSKLTLSDVLNCLDGILELTDSILIITTNYIDSIDPALIRYGRITYKLYLNKMDKNDINDMIFHYFNTHINNKYLQNDYILASTLDILCQTSDNISDLESKLDIELNKL